LLLLTLIGLVASMLLIWREKEQTKSALAEAHTQAERAEANYQRAQDNLETAYRVLEEIYVDVAEKRLAQQTQLTPEDRQILEKALAFYEQFARQNSTDPSVRRKTSEAYLRVGAIQQRLGQTDKAAAAYREALAVAEKLAAEFPDDSDYRQNLARCYSSLGGRDGTMLGTERRPEMERALAEALRLQEQLVSEAPGNFEYQHDLGLTYNRLGHMRLDVFEAQGRLPKPGEQVEAEEPVRQALAIREKLVR
jgi:tetratricopeptide (TPR) repeat protein